MYPGFLSFVSSTWELGLTNELWVLPLVMIYIFTVLPGSRLFVLKALCGLPMPCKSNMCFNAVSFIHSLSQGAGHFVLLQCSPCSRHLNLCACFLSSVSTWWSLDFRRKWVRKWVTLKTKTVVCKLMWKCLKTTLLFWWLHFAFPFGVYLSFAFGR